MRTSINLQSITLIIVRAASALAADSNSSTCFFVNGDLAPQHVPCFPDQVSAGGDSACCEKSNGDVCLDTGICLTVGGMTYQGACTDQNWQSNSCPHRCPDPQDQWQGLSIRPQHWNILMCNWNTYCCRVDRADPNCCNNTAALSTTTASALGLPTQAAATTETVTLSAVVSSRSTSVLTTSAVRTAAAASNSTCASAVEAKPCQETSKTMAVGAGIGVSLGTFLIATLVALVVSIRRQKGLRSELARAQDKARVQESVIRELEKSAPISPQGYPPTESVNELGVPTPRVNELWVPTHSANELDGSRR